MGSINSMAAAEALARGQAENDGAPQAERHLGGHPRQRAGQIMAMTLYEKVLALPWWGWLLAAALSYMLGSETWWWMVCAAPVTNAIRMRQADAATFEAEEAAESAAAEEDKKAS